jgi:hypothetical protein
MEIKNYQLEPNPRELEGTKDSDEIYISIEIGNGQIGGSKVSHNEKTLAKGRLTEPTFIGNASELRNSEIEVETNILDVNSFTNMCVLTTKFYNQENQILFSRIDKGEAPENGIASFKGRYIINLLSMAFFILFSTSNLFSQNTTNDIKFENLETPSSPGFILLDNAPSSIERPTTPQGFGVSILGFFQGTGGAMEFAPFWLATHPKLTAEKMYKNKFPILYNFSISAATVKSDSSNYVAGGFRTRLFQTYGKRNIGKLDSIKSKLEDALAELDLEKIKKLQTDYSNLISKPIFTIDIAAAVGAGSVTNSFGDLELNRWAAWMSFNYRPKGNDFYITALTRYINNEKFNEYTLKADLLDIGSRVNYDINKFCVSLEYLHRLNLTGKSYSDYRIAAIGSYQISENFFITSTFGKNFTDVNNIIAMAGVNFGFSKTKVKAYE